MLQVFKHKKKVSRFNLKFHWCIPKDQSREFFYTKHRQRRKSGCGKWSDCVWKLKFAFFSLIFRSYISFTSKARRMISKKSWKKLFNYFSTPICVCEMFILCSLHSSQRRSLTILISLFRLYKGSRVRDNPAVLCLLN